MMKLWKKCWKAEVVKMKKMRKLGLDIKGVGDKGRVEVAIQIRV